MSVSNHELVSRLFLEARRLALSDRASFLAGACDGDDALIREIEAMLLHDGSADGFLEKPAIDPTCIESRPVPKNVGEYRIIRYLGEGGMGAVYLAEQQHPRRRVALKVMLSAWASPRMLKRFEHETQVLARLQHVGIAQIFEAAVAETPSGPQPYFAMEYVEGQPITVSARALSIRDKLALMIRVCDAVQHAHQKGVIHRDLKPSNILVADHAADDASGDGMAANPSSASSSAGRTNGRAATYSAQPKILDFGIARVTDPDGAMGTMLTKAGELVGTLPYMSPEQLAGDPAAVDTRADIYALGLILYELFAGKPARDLERCGWSDAARIIGEQEPASLGSVDRSLRGDIETIVAKAIERDRQRRYQSAGEMAADIQRYLDDEPIVARPSSRLYQLRKFARRNRSLVAAVAVAFLALSAGLATTSWQAVRAQRAARRAEKVNDFLRHMFAAIDPHVHGQEIRVMDIVKRAEDRIESIFGSEPLLEAEVRDEVASIFLRLGALDDAEAQYAMSLDIRRGQLGQQHPLVFDSIHQLGMVLSKQARFADAEPLLRDALTGRKKLRGASHPDTLVTMNDLSTTLQALGKLDEAASLCRTAVETQTRIHGAEHLDTLTATANLASILQALGESQEAERLHQRSVEGLSNRLGADHPTTLLSVANLARLLKDQKRYDEAEPLQHRVVDGLVSRLGSRHPDSLIARANLAMMLWRQDKLDGAEAMYREVRGDFATAYGADHGHVMTVTTQLALVLEKQSKNDEAAELLRIAVDGYRNLYGEDHPKTMQVIRHLDRVQSKVASNSAMRESETP